jgi:hypothetical protein
MFFFRKTKVVAAKPVEKAPEFSKDGLTRIQRRPAPTATNCG